ncbi:phenazine biosynthesis-like domain-containing protein 1 isoform X1 [Liolophura sinensis]|uniref:phenazine biosynthesis-like domain-containing protein 1 isoform X1 n=1 Tax=Liolophura sinensis TaxID=3198878 RepID=UPI0031588988
MTTVRMFTVDAFTNECFLGNPAAVCLDTESQPIPDDTKQKMAAEMNLSETAFVRPLRAEEHLDTGNRFNLRWFTPLTEVKMCGHATLATAFIIFDRLKNPSPEITFETLSGELIVRRDGDFLEMDFPTGTIQPENTADHQSLLKALLGNSDAVEEVVLCEALKYLLVRLKDGWTREEFEHWSPPVGSLPEADKTGKMILVIVTVKGPPEKGFVDKDGTPYDFVSRSFAPWTGVPEDPVTGSAHTVLSQYWSQHLDKNDFYARQCSRRGGDVWVMRQGERTVLRGQAVSMLEAQFHL